jgi:GT2 family glycosyltransferase
VTAPRIAVLLTCHNRVDRTLACLDSLDRQHPAHAMLDIVVVDAGSTDGTAEAVVSRFPEVNVLRRGPDLYWNGGMRVALAHAYKRDPDLYLWLNDDVELDADAVDRLLASHRVLLARRLAPCIVVGSTRDPENGSLTYGGVVRPERLRPLHYERVEPGDTPRRAETMNGNCVLVPRTVVTRIGNLAAAYTHGMGDYDYCHRAVRAGCEVWVAPDSVGTCSRNPPRSQAASLGAHSRQALSPLGGLPPSEWFTFARRWAGPLWFVYALSPYLRRLLHWTWGRGRAGVVGGVSRRVR